MRALYKDDMNGDERFIYTMVWCEIFGYVYPSRYAHISLSYCPSITTLQRQVPCIIYTCMPFLLLPSRRDYVQVTLHCTL